MLGKLVVLCVCLALASANPAKRERFSQQHFGLVESCDVDGIISAAQSIGKQTLTFSQSLAVEIANIQAGVTLCSNPLDIPLCLAKGIPEILKNAKQIVANVEEYMDDVKTEVPALISNVKACL